MSLSVIGSIFADIKAYPYDKFIPRGRNPGYSVEIHGGVARNIAEDLANMGIGAELIALADKSAMGSDIIGHLNKNKVGTRFIKKTENGIGRWIAVFNDNNDVYASISVRPNLKPLTDILDEYSADIFKKPEAVILEADIDESALDRALYYARKYNRKINCVVSLISLAQKKLINSPYVDCFICNLDEAEMFFDLSLKKEDINKLRSDIYKNFKNTLFDKLIVTLGERGSVYFAKSKEEGYCPAVKVCAKDTTGAGDAFAAGVFAALSKGHSLDRAVNIGTRAASFVVSSKSNVCPVFNYNIFE